MFRIVSAIVLVSAMPALADVIVPVRTIRAKEVITAADVTIKLEKASGAIELLQDIVGKEARVSLYPGRPVRFNEVRPPAIVDRNDLVTLVFDNGSLSISTEARALGRGASGDVIRVMNLNSRTTLTGQIRPDGSIEVE